ncbi:MAG: hypothetical protein ACKVHE_34830, partial [Planctomycetales bacterium]
MDSPIEDDPSDVIDLSAADTTTTVPLSHRQEQPPPTRQTPDTACLSGDNIVERISGFGDQITRLLNYELWAKYAYVVSLISVIGYINYGPHYPVGLRLLTLVNTISLITIIVLYGATTLALASWLYKAARNAQELGLNVRVHPTLAALSWYVPLLSFATPYFAIQHVWSSFKSRRIPLDRLNGIILLRLFVLIAVLTWWLALS